jgi:hypothetical protein
MHKKVKRLTLHRETLRWLSGPSLQTVHGGASGETLCQEYGCYYSDAFGCTFTCVNTTQVGQTECLECEM